MGIDGFGDVRGGVVAWLVRPGMGRGGAVGWKEWDCGRWGVRGSGKGLCLPGQKMDIWV